MRIRVSNSRLELVQGDITEQETEAIVNAANKRLSPGGGVSGAIHRAAGPNLWEECKTLGGCETGEAKITKGYDLKAKHVIHTVGPVYSGKEKDAEYLKRSYLNSLKLAEKHGIKTISFPAISTGAFGYPIEEAAKVSLKAVMNLLNRGSEIELVRFVLFNKSDFEVYERTLKDLI